MNCLNWYQQKRGRLFRRAERGLTFSIYISEMINFCYALEKIIFILILWCHKWYASINIRFYILKTFLEGFGTPTFWSSMFLLNIKILKKNIDYNVNLQIYTFSSLNLNLLYIHTHLWISDCQTAFQCYLYGQITCCSVRERNYKTKVQ